MQMCQSHWDMLRAEVVEQGMGDLVSGNSEIAAMRITAELNGSNESKTDFDPLMRCYFMVLNRTAEIAGLEAFTPYFGCPICRLNAHRNPDGSCPCTDPHCHAKAPGSVPDFETWLVGPESCVASVREYAHQQGWLS